MTDSIYELHEITQKHCFLHDQPHPCPMCLLSSEGMKDAFGLLTKPGTIVTSCDLGSGEDYGVEVKAQVEENGSVTILSRRILPPADGGIR